LHRCCCPSRSGIQVLQLTGFSDTRLNRKLKAGTTHDFFSPSRPFVRKVTFLANASDKIGDSTPHQNAAILNFVHRQTFAFFTTMSSRNINALSSADNDPG
jgi:hypothetical protein